MIAELKADLPSVPDALAIEMEQLRTLKRQIHLVIALSDISNLWSWVEVTEALTQLSDLCMDRLLYAVAKDAGLPIGVETTVPGLFILAVGKYGARELNYSSDIDFNVFYNPEILELPDPNRAERILVRLMQKFIRAFEQDQGAGYIFRTDLRLRPDPRSNSIVVSTQTAERYYEVLGQNWERAAMIKARVCAGDFEVGQAFIKEVLTPFIWRRNLDYAAIEDIHSIKRQMQSVKGLTTLEVAGHNMKLGLGGIREIEFFAQVQQLILGGRHPELRTPRTVDALQALAEGGFVNSETAKTLTRVYGDLRFFEHCAQMMEDAQTHIAPEDDTKRLALGRLAGFEDLASFDHHLKDCFLSVHAIYNGLFPESKSLSSGIGNLVFTGVEPGPATLKTLENLGFSDAEAVWQNMADWLGGRVQATRSERSREILTSLAPKILELCSETGQAEQAFRAFASFFTEMKTGVTTLTMFARHPERLAHIIELMLASPRIRETIAAQPRILDVMSDPEFLDFTDEACMLESASNNGIVLDFEESLNRVRRIVREDHFRICAATLSGHIPAQDVPGRLSNIADRAVATLLPVAAREVERRFGLIGGGYAVLGLGKLGGRELSLSSDLDIMVIYEPDDATKDIMIFTRLTQRLISALSVQTAEGGLFEVDMALRPSGKAGPVAVSAESFKQYYKTSAWTWEFMALSRARVIAASSPEFSSRLENWVQEALQVQRDDLDFSPDILDMRQRTAREKQPKSEWDIKEMPGGLRDIEYIAQALFLKDRTGLDFVVTPSTRGMLKRVHNRGLLKAKHSKTLLEALEFYLEILTIGSIISRQPLSLFDSGEIERLVSNTGSKSVKALNGRRDAHFKAVKALRSKFIGPV